MDKNFKDFVYRIRDISEKQEFENEHFRTPFRTLELQVSHLTSQVSELQRSLTTLQEETDTTITKLKQELADKANIVETLQQQIRMKMFMNLTREKGLQANPMMAALVDMQGIFLLSFLPRKSIPPYPGLLSPNLIDLRARNPV